MTAVHEKSKPRPNSPLEGKGGYGDFGTAPWRPVRCAYMLVIGVETMFTGRVFKDLGIWPPGRTGAQNVPSVKALFFLSCYSIMIPCDGTYTERAVRQVSGVPLRRIGAHGDGRDLPQAH